MSHVDRVMTRKIDALVKKIGDTRSSDEGIERDFEILWPMIQHEEKWVGRVFDVLDIFRSDLAKRLRLRIEAGKK